MLKVHDLPPRQRIRRRLEFVYGEEAAPQIADRIDRLIDRYREKTFAGPPRSGWDQTDALLITYADTLYESFESPLTTLRLFLDEYVGDAISFVHLLPFFPWSSDDGFAVKDFREVESSLGDWDDVADLARQYRLVFDAVINHVSAGSVYMRGYGEGDPNYRDYFIALDPETDTSSVLRTRNLPLLHDYETHEGTKWLWTTFSRDQVDLNFANPDVLIEVLDVLLFYAERGAGMVRLDAIPYLWKELGTTCAHLPQTHELIKLIRDVYDAAAEHVLLLTETNVPHHENVSYFGDAGDEAQMIYNFSLPPMILFSLVTGDASKLTDWAKQIEKVSDRTTYLNITATHDGIGMRPTEGLLSEDERRMLCDLARAHHGDVTGKRNADGSVSPYELNLNYFDAVNDPDADEPLETQIDRFFVSQAIPLSFIGIPGIYIHSLIGSRNDLAGVERSGRARSINRRKLKMWQLVGALNAGGLPAQVLDRYLELLRRRATISAFHPDAGQAVLDLGAGIFAIRRHNDDTGQTVTAVHNVTEEPQSASLDGRQRDLLSGESFDSGSIPLASYQVRWLDAG